MPGIDRPQLTDADLNSAMSELQKQVARRINEKGAGSFASRHEIAGAIDSEEMHEFREAVQKGTLYDVKDELLDIAVGCVIGIAGIAAKKVDW